MNRKEQRQSWLVNYFQDTKFQAKPASADASFRSYYRITTPRKTYVLMDAPPQHEDCRPFVAVSKLLSANGVNVPELYAIDFEQGFLLLEDFGDQLYLSALETNKDLHQTLYTQAIDSILSIQTIKDIKNQLPLYDQTLLMNEMQLFTDWFIGKHLGAVLSSSEQTILNQAFTLLKQSALDQPQVVVHRDYHSRNLMIVDTGPGVIDFQDAVFGPFTYDLASLLKDCYISWPTEVVQTHCQYFLDNYNEEFKNEIRMSQFMRWFELMAAQRHLKAIGIFCRLNYRDGKAGYLNDIPRTMKYLLATAKKHPELEAFSHLIQNLQTVLSPAKSQL